MWADSFISRRTDCAKDPNAKFNLTQDAALHPQARDLLAANWDDPLTVLGEARWLEDQIGFFSLLQGKTMLRPQNHPGP
jgi:hypothetical protein